MVLFKVRVYLLENLMKVRGRRGRDRMVVRFTTIYAITTDVVSLNLDEGDVYNIM